MYLKDRELAIRWWSRRTKDEKKENLERCKIKRDNLNSLTGSEIEHIWKTQPHND